MWRMVEALQERWERETDGAGLALMRICVALSIGLEFFGIATSEALAELLLEPKFHFKYALFPWVGPPQGLMPYVFVWVMVAVAAMVLVGWRTRWTASLMAVGYVYWFLIDAANYTDHRYLVCLLSILSAWLPVNRWASIDAYMGRETRTNVPGWCQEFVRCQLALIYLCFGLYLLNSDWLSGAPLLAWTSVESAQPGTSFLVGRPGLVMAVVWIVPLLSLAAGLGLWWRPLRWPLLLALCLFQIWDAWAFQLSLSPWLLTAVSLVFCEPGTFRRWGSWLVGLIPQVTPVRGLWNLLCRLGGMLDRTVSWFDDTPLVGERRVTTRPEFADLTPRRPTDFSTTSKVLVGGWLVIQCFLPFRFVTVEANPDWTDLTRSFSWRGQTRDKQCELKLSIIQPSQELRWPLDPTDEFPVPQAMFYSEATLEKLGLSEGTLKDLVSGPEETRAAHFAALKIPDEDMRRILSNHQSSVRMRLSAVQYEQMVQRPEFVRQYAHHLGEELSGLVGEVLQVHADLQVGLNHRPRQPILTDAEDQDLRDIPTANRLADRLPKLAGELPPVGERVKSAVDWAERRRIELEQNYDIVLDDSQPTGEPHKLPPVSDADEKWFQELLRRKS